jgi:hypothetical protein
MTEQRASFFAEVRLEHGPVELFRRFLRHADALHRAEGVTTSFGTLDELLDANRRNRDSWRGLFPAFDPDPNSIAPDDAFALLGRNAAGEVISAQAARLFDWTGTDLHREAESLRWFYRDPETSKRPGERCVVTAPSAKHCTGRVAFLGAAWYRPDYRKRMPTLVDLRIGPICALSRWRPAFFAMVMGEALATKGLAPRFGREPEWEIKFTNNALFGDERVALLASTYEESLARLEQYAASIELA